MTFNETHEGQNFIASGDSRETSSAVMNAIAFFARNEDEAEKIWNGDLIGIACTFLDIWENATSNGTKSVNLFWGVDGSKWATPFTNDN
jgi:hypothetical protein